ncbi:unnamed protein product [Rotaria magnacalcarata]
MTMKLESLSNEVLLDLFELLDVVNLLRAFSGLNTRFNSLLFGDFQSYRVDLRSMSKEDFYIFYSTYLPSILNRIIYLRLSDDEDTPCQCSHFQSTGFTLNRFTHLRSLIFNSFSTDVNINQEFFTGLHHLHNLKRLKFVDCRLYHLHLEDFRDVIDQIWNLPKLSRLYWHISFKCSRRFSFPKYTSRSLRNLTIVNYNYDSYDFACLLEKTPYLRKFSMLSDDYGDQDIRISRKFLPSSHTSSIRELTLFSIRSQALMTSLFQFLPHVTHLKIEIFSIDLDGHQWKKMIVNYLPQLKDFQFKIDLDLCRSIDDSTNEDKIDQYLSTYLTPFWIEHHQWFVRCHWYQSNGVLGICVYSLPYVFSYFPRFDQDFNFHTKSTCSPDMNHPYNSVRDIGYEPWMFHNEALSHIQMVNIEKLSLQLPIDQQFFSIIPKLENLLSLTVAIPTENHRLQLQALLDRAPRLFSLSFNYSIASVMPPYRYTGSSIRRLDLLGYEPWRCRHRYDSKQCMELSQSPLGIQCRILAIEVEEPKCIVQLIYSMLNLRTLHVSYENDECTNEYDLVKVLQHCLPSTWSITRASYGRIILQS